MEQNLKEIKVVYEDGTEKAITRGMVFEVSEKGDVINVRFDSFGVEMDDVAVLAIVSRLAKELGIDEELINKAKEVS